jgi:ABC-type branched-subunit amino acid transport system substrate-binding protein
MINIGGQDPALKELGPYILSALVLSDVTAKVAVDYIANELKLKKVAIIYANNPIGNSLQKAMEVAVKGTSVAIVGAFSFDGQQQDFGAILSRVSQSGPDVVYLATNGTPTAQIIKQSREQGLQFPFVSYVGVYGEIAKIAGAALNGLVWTSPQLDTASEAYKSYAAAYQKAHPTSQSSYVDVTAHDAVYIIASALATSAKKGGSWWTGERIRNEIIGVSSFSDLAGGSYLFQQDGTVLRPVQLYRQAATGPELIKTYKLDDLKKLN